MTKFRRLAAVLSVALIPVRGFCAETVSAQAAPDDSTFSSSEVLKAIGDLGGAASSDMAKVVEEVFAKSGRPSAIIVGDELQAAVIIGYRKGSGKLLFKGQPASQAMPLGWRAPSIGINIGGSASKVTVLVYGAHAPSQVLQRFVSIEGSFHYIAGAAISYMRSSLDADEKSPVSLAHVSVGLGLDAGVALESLSFHK